MLKRPWISVTTYICLENGDFAFRIRDNGAMMTSSILDNPETAAKKKSPHLIRPKCRFLLKKYKLFTVHAKNCFWSHQFRIGFDNSNLIWDRKFVKFQIWDRSVEVKTGQLTKEFRDRSYLKEVLVKLRTKPFLVWIKLSHVPPRATFFRKLKSALSSQIMLHFIDVIRAFCSEIYSPYEKFG